MLGSIKGAAAKIPVVGPAFKKAYLSWFAGEGKIRPIRGGLLSGMRYYRYRWSTPWEDLVETNWADEAAGAFARLVKGKKRIFDVGANWGFYVLLALGQHGAIGRWWQSMTGHTLAFTFTGVVIGSVLYSFPFAVQPFATALASVDSRLLAASDVLGVSKFQTFWRVLVPLSVSGLVTGVALSFAHTMGEFGVVLMVGGNIPGVTRTLSINIYDQVQNLNYAAANTTALVLVAIAFILLSLVYSLNRKFWSLGPRQI